LEFILKKVEQKSAVGHTTEYSDAGTNSSNSFKLNAQNGDFFRYKKIQAAQERTTRTGKFKRCGWVALFPALT